MKSEDRFFNDFIPYWNTLWVLFAVGLLGRGIEPYIGYRAVGFLFLFAVILVGFVARLGPVLFAAAASWLSWNYFFIPPRFTFAIETPEDAFMGATYFVVAIATGLLANQIKSQQALILEREERTNLLYEVMLELSADENKAEFLTTITQRLAHVLRGECGLLLRSPSGELESGGKKYSFNVDGRELEAAQKCFKSGQLTGLSTDIVEDAEALYVPIKGENETVGVFRYKPEPDQELSIDQENLLQSVCRQVGVSLEQRFVRKRLQEAERLRESELMHQTLLNSISHELRTPLSVIIASASALGKNGTPKSEAARTSLIMEQKNAAERLNRVVENLLDMSRLSVGGIAIKKEWHDLHDLIGVTAAHVQESIGTANIVVEIPDNLPLVKIDFKMMEHALFNLLVNAFTYSPSGSKVSALVARENSKINISVEDEGPGIREEYLSKVFERFFRVPNSPTGGTGLGLSIAKSIVEFHDGSIEAENRLEGGARFRISLPYKDAPVLPAEPR